jgi:hypothetical protein
MDDVVEAGIQQALARTVLDQSSQALREALLLEVWERHRAELQAQALAAVREEHAQALEDLQERLRDGVARERRQLEHDADAAIEEGIQRGLAEATLDYEERLAECKQQRDQARQDRDEATHLLLQVLRQVIGPKPVYLHSRGITELDLYRLNRVLSRHGLRLRSKRTASERQVQTQLEVGRVAPRSLFWLDSVPVGTSPALDEDDDEDEAPPAAPVPALPPVAAPPPEVGF